MLRSDLRFSRAPIVHGTEVTGLDQRAPPVEDEVTSEERTDVWSPVERAAGVSSTVPMFPTLEPVDKSNFLLIIPSFDAASAAWPHQNWPPRGTIRSSGRYLHMPPPHTEHGQPSGCRILPSLARALRHVRSAACRRIRLAKHLHGHGGCTSQGCQVYPCMLAAWTEITSLSVTSYSRSRICLPDPVPCLTGQGLAELFSHPTGRIQLGSTPSCCPDAALVQPRPSAAFRAPLGTACPEYRGFVGDQVACCGRPRWRQDVLPLLLQTIAGRSILRPLFFSLAVTGSVPWFTRSPVSRRPARKAHLGCLCHVL